MQEGTSTGGGGDADERLEELRLALVLNGGVSLAVWMGGVSFELNRLVRETHPVYQGLLRLTKTAARIDVISGSSAGGINGAALALAQIHDKSLYSLRDVWLDVGGLEKLMHEPDDEGLTSLLRGNDWFLPKIQSAFGALNGTDPAPASQVPMLLNLTTTLFDGESHIRLDDFGANIEDVVHRASWRFERLDDGQAAAPGAPAAPLPAVAPAPANDAFKDKQIVGRLAFAARSTASFPVAFEPAEYDPAGPLFAGSDVFRIEGRVPQGDKARLLLDGGILDNQPFEAALEGISRLAARGDTRRVLAYIVPDATAAADVRERAAEKHPHAEASPHGLVSVPMAKARELAVGMMPPQPTLAEVGWRSLVSIPMAQSIGSHMDQLKRHNSEANGRWQRVVGVVRHMSPSQLVAQAEIMMPAYRARRIDGLIDYLLSTIERGLSVDAADGDGAGQSTDMRRSTRRWMRSVWQKAIDDSVAAHAGIAPVSSDKGSSPAAPYGPSASPPAPTPVKRVAEVLKDRVPTDYAPSESLVSNGQWAWGLFGLEFLSDITLELLRRTQRLHAFVPRWEEDVRAAAARAGSAPPPTASSITTAARDPDPVRDDVNWENLDAAGSQVGAKLRTDTTRVGDEVLQPIWQAAYVLARRVLERRMRTETSAQKVGTEEFKRLIENWRVSDLNNQTTPAKLEAQAIEVMDKLLNDPKKGDYAANNAADAAALCQLILQLRGPMTRILKCFEQKTKESGTATAGAPASFSTQSRADVETAVEELRALRRFFFAPVHRDRVQPADRVAWRALALEVFEFTAGARGDAPDSQAEVVQISARLPSIWGGSDDPSHKLNGMQLAHFGAFYKRSWRANDWTFGRLDGIDRAVRIALNPDSLQRRYGARVVAVPGQTHPVPASQYVYDYLRRLAVDTAKDGLATSLSEDWDKDATLIRKELAWLDQDATVPPPVLEYCARALTRRLQLEALRAELPEIAASLRIEAQLGAPPSTAGQSLLQRVPHGTVPSKQTVEVLMKENLIGSDSMKQQGGTDLFTRTASRAMSITHGALSGNGGLHAIDIVFRITDWPLRVLYLLTNRMMQGSRTNAAGIGLALGLGLALVAASVLADKLPVLAPTLGWALLAGVFARMLLGASTVGKRVMLVVVPAVVLAIIVTLVKLSVLPSAFAVACALLVLLALQPWIPAVSTSAIVLVIAAWTVHASVGDWQARLTSGIAASVDVVSGTTAQQCAKEARPTPPLDAERVKNACERRAAAERIESVQWPVLGLVGVLLLAALGFQAGRFWRLSRRWWNLRHRWRRLLPRNWQAIFARRTAIGPQSPSSRL